MLARTSATSRPVGLADGIPATQYHRQGGLHLALDRMTHRFCTAWS